MNIPKKIKIGGLTYAVMQLPAKELTDCAGEMDSLALTIKVREGKSQAMELVFLHEILHAINNEVKETDIEYMAQALYQIIIDNPMIFKGGDSARGKQRNSTHN